MGTLAALDQIPGLVPEAQTVNKSSNELGQEDFMTLLVAQLQNQDPTKPMDNFQFLSQIAQFGMVDGIQGLQGSFSNVAENLQQARVMQVSALLGREVVVAGEHLTLGADGGAGGIALTPEGANVVDVEIRDASGRLIRSMTMSAGVSGERAFHWDGLDNQGEVSAPGIYQVSARGFIADQWQSLDTLMVNRVDSITIDLDGSDVELGLSNGESALISSIREVR